jgi:hypothetical protein
MPGADVSVMRLPAGTNETEGFHDCDHILSAPDQLTSSGTSVGSGDDENLARDGIRTDVMA